ncbi:type II secretion system F family protein [Actinobacillus pleuropneumoniae]|uniref:ApfC n=2 Tax=Actinobacillus pleuropneumoniae TaxID=715 RepID=A0A3G2M2S7_ACTPL|nr:type II secretion system F family protein [Actinobacillus pleuropneumoniae]AYN80539.1 ApfC [Actinobacillus pleuropneumoniae serovar 10 str. D13039]AYN80547.1 ApfC [Actinobacillus pleuropneumoniae]EFM96570.1 Fimbrial bioproteinsis protein [Actinobacillus pleuropneumoniae serovar 10 str. D13039]EFN00896.1 Fimbrial bioproteinsis protein [Actinobacillus pleuropneumoniae serovar 12 str. 1096]UKH28634.1 type II secretion system F family protein [Actinobacillus pleuropneumoniae]
MLKVYEFHWKAKNRFQQLQKGKALACHRTELERRLLAKGYSQIRIQRNFRFVTQASSESITQVIKQLALLLNAAVPLKQALNMLLENTYHIRIYMWLNDLNRLIESGYTMSSSLTKLNLYLAKSEIQLVRIGEQSGRLGEILQNIAVNRYQTEKLHKKIKKIMFYPVVTLIISVALSLAMLLFIVPQFIELYSGREKPLPLITQMLFTLSLFLQHSLLQVTIVSLLAVGFFRFFAKKYRFLTAIKNGMLSALPIFNKIVENVRIVFFSQNLGLMLKAHIRLETALNTFLATQSQDLRLQKEIENILAQLKQGYRFSESINASVFGTQVVQMLAIGEQSGNVAQMCSYIGELYRQQLDDQIELLSQLLEPILMLIIGLIIGTVLIGLYLPIFDLGGLVGGG